MLFFALLPLVVSSVFLSLASSAPVEPAANFTSEDSEGQISDNGGHTLASIQTTASSYSETYSGDGTFYLPGLGACGKTNHPGDLIVAVGHQIFDSYPCGFHSLFTRVPCDHILTKLCSGANPRNPNKNPICGKKMRVTYGQKSVVVAVEDRCAGCAGAADLDFTETGFAKLASPNQGRIHGVKWAWV